MMGIDFGKWDDIENPSFDRALNQAQVEGRLHPDIAEQRGVDTGQCVCSICGMRHWLAEDAVECCKADNLQVSSRQAAIDAMAPRAGDAFAGVLYPDELTGAIENLMETIGCRTSIALADHTGLSILFVNRALAGNVSWIGKKNWRVLIIEFEGDVPGCEKYPFG